MARSPVKLGYGLLRKFLMPRTSRKSLFGAVPAGWVNTQGKYRVVEIKEDDGMHKVLFKVNNNPRPPLARANAYITLPSSTNYTIQADMKGVAVNQQLGDMGVIANRYLLLMDPKTTPEDPIPKLRLVTWEALPPEPAGRVSASTHFKWSEKVWYTVKLTVTVEANQAIAKGKAWEARQGGAGRLDGGGQGSSTEPGWGRSALRLCSECDGGSGRCRDLLRQREDHSE